MLNQFVIVGRLVENPKIEENDKRVIITLAIPRSYKNNSKRLKDLMILGIYLEV